MNIGLDKMEVRAIFRRTVVGRLKDLSLIDYIADAVANVIEENNKRILETLQEATKKTK